MITNVTITFPNQKAANAFRQRVLEMEGDMMTGFGWYIETHSEDGNYQFVPRLTADGNLELLTYNVENDKVLAN